MHIPTGPVNVETDIHITKALVVCLMRAGWQPPFTNENDDISTDETNKIWYIEELHSQLHLFPNLMQLLCLLSYKVKCSSTRESTTFPTLNGQSFRIKQSTETQCLLHKNKQDLIFVISLGNFVIPIKMNSTRMLLHFRGACWQAEFPFLIIDKFYASKELSARVRRPTLKWNCH